MASAQAALHQLMPAVLTCLVGKRLCANALDDHWTLRHHAASLVRELLSRFKGKSSPRANAEALMHAHDAVDDCPRC